MSPATILWTNPTYPNRWALKIWPCREGTGHAEHDVPGYATMDCAERRFGVRVQPITEPRDWFAEQKPQVEAPLRVRAT